MTALRRGWSMARFVVRSLRSSWALSLAVIVATAALVSVWVGLPLYAESASARLLSTQVSESAEEGVPFGYLFSYNRLSGGNKTLSEFGDLNQLLDGDDRPFGPNVRATQRVFRTVPFDLTLQADSEPTVLDAAPFASMSTFDELATITEGRLAEPAAAGEVVEVVIDQAYAENLDLGVGQRLTAINRRVELDDPRRFTEVVVVGLWAPPEATESGDPDPETRFLRVGELERKLVVPESTLANAIDPLTEATVSNAQWLALLDSSTITTDSVQSLLASTERINRQVDNRLRGARMLISPETSLQSFRSDVERLNRGLTLFSLPIIALTFSVAALLVSMRWQRRRSTVLMLRRRGVSAAEIIFQTGIEAVVMAGLSAGLGVVLARIVARFMGRTTTFLRLGADIDLALVMNSRSWAALGVATAVAALLMIAPSLAMLTRDISTDQGRDVAARPWWQRSRLDLVFIVGLALFSWFLLRRVDLSGRLLDDPIVILLPAVTALAAGLGVLRLAPWLAGRSARLLERTSSTAALLVARRAERTPAAMAAPLLLLVITAAVAVYTGSLARTLDLQLFDTAYHVTGASNSARTGLDSGGAERVEIVDGQTVATNQPAPPIDPIAFERIWGVAGASRVGRAPAQVRPPQGESTAVTFIGVDTATFADIAFWRDDFATSSLPQLMSQLDATPDSVLVTEQVLRQARLELGDVVSLNVRLDGRVVGADMVIVGTFRQFPTWIPGQEPPPAVTSLSTFEARSPAGIPQDLLFGASAEGQDLAQTRADLNRVGISSTRPRSAESIVEQAQQRPERQGVFGLLTVGFALSAALTVVGFIFYAVFGFTRQLTELGVLRAFGLPVRSLSAIVALDLLLVASVGVGVGAATGLAMAKWYLPLLVDNPLGSAPTMLPEIDWAAAAGISLVLAAVLAAVTVVLLTTLRRLKLFTAVKFDQGAAQ